MRRTLTGILICLTVSFGAASLAMAQTAPRFPPIPREQLTPEQRAWADSLAAPPRNGNVNNPPYRAYLPNMALATRWTALSDYVRWNTSLPPRLSELAILVTARHWTAQYEWHAHYTLAEKGGLDPKIADQIAAGKRPEGMKADEKIVYNVATELYRDKNLSDATYKAAVDMFGQNGLLDMIGIIGHYGTVSMILISMQAQAPNDSVKPLAPLAAPLPR